MRSLVIGLGAGLLPMFLYKHLMFAEIKVKYVYTNVPLLFCFHFFSVPFTPLKFQFAIYCKLSVTMHMEKKIVKAELIMKKRRK